jgi:dienelactone hydrolase
MFMGACQTPATSAPPTPTPATVATESISPTIEPTHTSAPTSTATSLPLEEPQPEITSTPAEEVVGDAIFGVQEEIEAADGLQLIGTFYAPVDFEPPWPGVILLHMLWSDRTAWDEYALQLAGSGYAVFALDMRGHGETGGEIDWDLAALDLQQVWDNLAERPDIDPARMGIIGASIGANMALVGGANEPDARTVVLLSPGLSYAGVETKEAMVTFGERPVFIAASQEDTYAADSSRKLHEIAVGEAMRLEMFQDAGHGIFMLENEPELGGQIIEWLMEYLQ